MHHHDEVRERVADAVVQIARDPVALLPGRLLARGARLAQVLLACRGHLRERPIQTGEVSHESDRLSAVAGQKGARHDQRKVHRKRHHHGHEPIRITVGPLERRHQQDDPRERGHEQVLRVVLVGRDLAEQRAGNQSEHVAVQREERDRRQHRRGASQEEHPEPAEVGDQEFPRRQQRGCQKRGACYELVPHERFERCVPGPPDQDGAIGLFGQTPGFYGQGPAAQFGCYFFIHVFSFEFIKIVRVHRINNICYAGSLYCFYQL